MTTGARSIGSREPSAIFTVLIATVLLVLALPAMAYASNIFVATTGIDAPGRGTLVAPYATVQYAISNAASGDVVHVGEGTFSGDVTMTAGVSVEGAGPTKTTIKGTGTNNVVVADGIGANTTITGFTITGGGLWGGVYCYNGSSLVINNDNVSGNGGLGIRCDSSSPTITNDNVSGNSEHGIFFGGGSPVLINDTVIGNGGCGIYCSSSSTATITNDTVSGNHAVGIYSDDSAPVITNCIVWQNGTGELFGCSATYSDTVGGGGVGDISLVPRFVSAATGNYRLKVGSPCIDKGTSVGAPKADKDGIHRPQGVRFDMGAYEYHVVVTTHTKLSARSSVKVKKSLRLAGTIRPALAPGSITITKSRLVGNTWTIIGTKTVRSKKGSFSYTFKPAARGKWRFVATYAGYMGGKNHTVYASSRSKTVTVKVK